MPGKEGRKEDDEGGGWLSCFLRKPRSIAALNYAPSLFPFHRFLFRFLLFALASS